MKKNQDIAYGIIGLGRFGSALARTLAEAGQEVIVLDKDEDKIKDMRQYTEYAFVTENLSQETLAETGIQNCDVVIVCIGEQVDVSILTTMRVIEMGIPHVISKALSAEQGAVLKKLGAEVVYPERDMALRLGRKLLSNNFLDYVSLNNSVEIRQVQVPQPLIGRSVEETEIRQKYKLNIIAIAGGALAAFVAMSVYKMDFDHLTYQIALPLMAAGFLFLPMHEPWNVIGTAVHQFGYQYFYIVLWALWPVLASRGSVPTGWVVGWGLLCIQLGQFVGSVAAAIALTFVQSDLGLAMVSAGVIFAILIIALFAMGSGSANTGWGFVKPMEEADAASDFEKAGTRLARRCRLSPREIEVFFLLAKGRNRAYIREELVIGDETVKSHIKSIYRKADVHSQQELIDLLERESSADEPRGRG